MTKILTSGLQNRKQNLERATQLFNTKQIMENWTFWAIAYLQTSPLCPVPCLLPENRIEEGWRDEQEWASCENWKNDGNQLAMTVQWAEIKGYSLFLGNWLYQLNRSSTRVSWTSQPTEKTFAPKFIKGVQISSWASQTNMDSRNLCMAQLDLK